MKIVALTGSIGMGKSTVASMFGELGAAVWDADAAVHRLYAKGGAGVAPIAEAFPAAVVEGQVDRGRLSSLVLNDGEAFSKLEGIIHPLVAEDRTASIAAAMASGAALIVLDIPLLFETGAEKYFETVIVVSAPYEIQKARVLARPGMTGEKFDQILAKQTPDAEKRARATHIIETVGTLEDTRVRVEEIWRELVPSERE
ncbi:MAG: dephospho-CoA kinase [Pseudomonadota bacterium]